MWRWVHAPEVLRRENSYRSLEFSLRRNRYRHAHPPVVIACARCCACLLTAVTATAVLFAVLRNTRPLQASPGKALVEAAETLEPAKDLKNMDPQSVRVRWKSFNTQCLGVWREKGLHTQGSYGWTVWQCRPTEEAWWRQRFILPRPGVPGQIKSLIGEVYDASKREYCLTVQSCVTGTPVLFMPCSAPSKHTEFVLKQSDDGTIKINTPSCPKNHCVDVPDQNVTLGNYAQVWHCKGDDKEDKRLLKVDETFSVGISQQDEQVFKAMVISNDGPPSCRPVRVPFEKGLGVYHSRCPTSSAGSNPLKFTFDFAPGKDDLSAYATIWSLWCEEGVCSCSDVTVGESFASTPRQSRSTVCGALMLSTHPDAGECPKDLTALEEKLTVSGKADCEAGHVAVRELAEDPSTHSRLLLKWVKAVIVGISVQDIKSFKAMKLTNSSGGCNASKPEGEPLEKISVRCPQDDEGADLGLEMTATNGSDLTKGSTVWALWCIRDECKCKAASKDRELVSAKLHRGEEGCAVMMMSVHSKFGACPPDLVQLQRTIEGSGDEIDCEAGKAASEQIAADPDNEERLRLKWVEMERDQSALDKLAKSALNIFSVVGGVVVIGTVPAWPAVAKFSQFLVMMASNHAELGVPEEFNSFARKFSKFNDLVKPLKNFHMPGLSDLGLSLDFLASSKWFILKEALMHETMMVVVRVLNSSGMISSGTACFLDTFYDPARRELGNLTAALEKHDGKDPCDYSEDASEGRRLAEEEEEEVDPDDLVASDGGPAAAKIRQHWEDLQAVYDKPIKFLEDKLDYTKKEFSVTKSLLFCLMVLPALIPLYLLICIVLYCTKHRLSFIPHLRPSFLLVFLADLVLLNMLMAWANVVWRRRLLQCENPFQMLYQATQAWEGLSINEPLTSAFMAVVNYFKPIISLFALWDGLHIGLEQSKLFANIIFVLGPCLIFFGWVLHAFCSGLGRHERTNRFLDQECKYLKATQPVVGSFFKRVLFYEPTNVAEVSRVVATKADGEPLYATGDGLQGSVWTASLVQSLRSCCNEEAKEKKEGVDIQVEEDPELVKPMSDESIKLDWAYRLHGFEVGCRGLPQQITIAFEASGDRKPSKPELRLHLARGSQVLSVAFQARSSDPNKPLPAPKKLGDNPTDEEQQAAQKALLAVELLQSSWRKRLLARVAELVKPVSSDLEVGGLRWTMWDLERNEHNPWILASFNVLLPRIPGTEDAAYTRSAASVKQRLEEDVKANFRRWDIALHQGWTDAHNALNSFQANCQSAIGMVPEGPVWREIAERAAKASLTPEQNEWAFAEVDLSRVQVSEVATETPDHYHKRVEQEEEKAEKSKTSPRGEENPNMEDAPPDTMIDGEQVFAVANVNVTADGEKPLAPAKDPKAPQVGQPKTTGHGYFMNVSAATSFEDDRLEQLELDFYLDRGKLFLVLSSDVFRHTKRGDLVEIWLAGKNEEEPEGDGSASSPLTTPSWSDVLKKDGAKVHVEDIKPWDDRSNPFSEVAVLREKQDRNPEWLKAVRRFPDAFVGKVDVPLQLQESTFCDLTLKVASRDLLHLKEEVPLTVPLDHLQLRSRDQWRVFYLSDHRMRKDELPQIIKIINGLNTFCMVMAVVLVPQNYNPEEMEKKNKEANEKWAEACRNVRGAGEGKCNADHKEFSDMTKSAELAQHVVTGISAAMVAICVIVVIKVLLNCWNDGELKLKLNSFKSTWSTIKMEWAHFMKIFNREKTVILKVQNLNYTKVESDPNLASTLLQVVRGKTKGVEPDTIHADVIVPEGCDAVVYAKAKSDPKKKEIMTTHSGNSEEAEVKLVYEGVIDPKENPGCVPTGVEQGIGLMLAKHAGEKGQGWFRQLTQAVKSTVSKLTGWSEAKDTTRICRFTVTAADKGYKELTEVEIDLEPAMKEAFQDGAEATEFTCASIWVRMTLPVSAKVITDDICKAIDNEEELRAARVGKLEVELEEEERQRCPSWLTFGFVLNVLKLLLVIFVGIVCLANGGNIFQAVFAMLLCFALWMLSRLSWDNAVEGTLFKSSTMEIGQVAIILVALLCQLNFLNRFSASCVMIIGVLWAIVLLCCRFLNDQIKMWQKDISKRVDTVVKTMKKSLDYYTKGIPKAIREFWDWLLMAIKRYKVRFFHWCRITWHSFSADTRDPAWRWGILFGVLCFLSIIAIAVVQTVALRHLGEQVTGSRHEEDDKHAQLVRQIPFMLGIFALTLLAMIIALWLFSVFLPQRLVDCREAAGARDRHKRMSEDAVNAVWCSDPDTTAEDTVQRRKVRNMLIERERAYDMAGRAGSPSDPVADRVFFDPLGGLSPVASVQVFADDGGSIMQGSLLLHSGQVPFKRLLCTKSAWDSPRRLVEQTPVQVSLKDLGIGKVSTDTVPWVEPKQKVLVGTLQIVNFVGLTVGKTQENDGVLTFWRAPELELKGQLMQWFEDVRVFFRDYGASFEQGSGVYGVLESLFWGIKDYGGESTQASGVHLQDHKSKCMLKKDGVPHQSWLNRNMEQIVRTMKVGPKDAQKADWGTVSDDEENPEVLKKIKEPPKPAEDKAKSTWLGGMLAKGQDKQQQKKGTLTLRIVSASNLANESARVVCEVKTESPQSIETQSAPKSSNPTFNHSAEVPNFYPGKTALFFQVSGDATRDLGSKEITLSAQETSRAVILETGSAKPGCCAGSAPAQAKLNIEYSFQEDSEETSPRSSPPVEGTALKASGGAGKTSAPSDAAFPSSSSADQLRTKRGAPCAGFCGGPLAWALMYPPTLPQLLHVVVTAEDLRPPEQSSKLVLFGSAPKRNGALPPLREQRALPRERMAEERPEVPEAE